MEKCEAIVARDKKVIAPCQHLSYYPLVVDDCDGAYITDKDGNRFIDFLSSASSLNLGSSHPVVNEAIIRQTERFTQYTAAYSYNEEAVAYAERLVSVYPGGVKAKVCFGNSGSDSNDAAVKFCRAYTGRSKIITFVNGYHGNSYGAATMSACTVRMSAKIGPMLPDVYHFPFFGTDVDDETCRRSCLARIEEAFATWLPPEEVAAVIIEPLQGDGGQLPAHPIFMEQLYGLCRRHGILFISEEVQQGFWRTGKWFSIEHYGIVPDGIVMGKTMGGGLPLGAFMARSEIMDTLPAPAHVFTLSGNALSCAAGSAAFDHYQTEAFQMLLQENIAVLRAEAEALQKKHPDKIGFVRGLGMSMGIGICSTAEDGTQQPDNDGTFKILFRCYEMGLIVISLAGHVLRIQPPLNAEPDTLRRGFAIIDEAICQLKEGAIGDEVLCYRAGW